MTERKSLLAGLFFLISMFAASQLFAQGEQIEQRQKLMKSNSAASKAIKKAVEEKDYATVELKAKDIAGNADKAGALFPKGSTADNSRAKPEIWEKWDEFSKEVTAFKTAASELAEAAAAKDESRVGDKFKALGRSCSSCHKAFRAEKRN